MSTCAKACGNCGKVQPDAEPVAVSLPEAEDDADDLLPAVEQDLVRRQSTAVALKQRCDGEQAEPARFAVRQQIKMKRRGPTAAAAFSCLSSTQHSQARTWIQPRTICINHCMQLLLIAWFTVRQKQLCFCSVR